MKDVQSLAAGRNDKVPVALVTGAFSGIGLATALALGDAGFRVYATGRNVETAPLVLRSPRTGAGEIVVIGMDVDDADGVDAAFHAIEQASGRLDVLVNNAGHGVFGAVTAATDDDIRRQFETTILGTVRTSRAALRLMARRGEGRIINIGTAAGRIAIPGMGTYTAAKFALVGLTDALALDLMTLGPRFHATIIEPAQVRTGFVEKAIFPQGRPDDPAELRGFAQHFRTHFAKENLAAPPPESVARAVVAAATSRRPRTRYVVGGAARFYLSANAILPGRWMRRVLFRAFRMHDISSANQSAAAPVSARSERRP